MCVVDEDQRTSVMCLPVILLSLAFCFLPVDIIHTGISTVKPCHALLSTSRATTRQNSISLISVRHAEHSFRQA